MAIRLTGSIVKDKRQTFMIGYNQPASVIAEGKERWSIEQLRESGRSIDIVDDEQDRLFDLDLKFMHNDRIKQLASRQSRRAVVARRGKKRRFSEADEEKPIDLADYTIAAVGDAIEGWTGLKVRHLRDLQVPNSFPEDQQDEDIPYTDENKRELIANSQILREMVFIYMSDYELWFGETEAEASEREEGNSGGGLSLNSASPPAKPASTNTSPTSKSPIESD